MALNDTGSSFSVEYKWKKKETIHDITILQECFLTLVQSSVGQTTETSLVVLLSG